MLENGKYVCLSVSIISSLYMHEIPLFFRQFKENKTTQAGGCLRYINFSK